MSYLKQQTTEIIKINSEFQDKKIKSVWSSYDKNVHKVVVPITTQSGIAFQMSEITDVEAYLKFASGGFGPFAGQVEDPVQKTVSFVVPEEVRGQTGSVTISIMLRLTGDRQVDLVQFKAEARISNVDQAAPEIQGQYVPLFENLRIEIEEKAQSMEDTLEALEPRIENAQQSIDAIEKGYAPRLSNLEINKADKTYVDSMLSSIAQGGPRELFYSLAALKAKYPNGNPGTYLVFDSSTSDGAHSYMWDTGSIAWKDLGVYQATAIAVNSITTDKYKDDSVTPEKTSFMKNGTNMFDPNSVVRGYYVDMSGREVALEAYSYIKDISLKSGESIMFYDSNGQILPMRFVTAYNSNGSVLTDNSAQNIPQTYFTATGATAKVTITIATTLLTRNLMLSYGTTAKAFEEFSILPQNYVDLSEKQISTVKKLVAEGSQDTGTGKNVMVTISGTNLSVKSFENDHDIVITGILNGSANGSFNFAQTAIDGSIIHATPDDITPLRTFATVGANHGYPYLISATVTSHNKTNADLGSVWSDGTNNFTLIEVTSATVLKFLPDYVVRSDGSINVSVSSLLGNLTHVSGAANTSNIVISTQSTGQLYPSIRNIEQKSNEIPIQDMTVFINEFSLVESYEVLDYKSLIDWSKANVGKKYIDNISQIDSVATYSTVYSFKEGGQCLINSSVLFKKKTLVGNLGFLQAAALNQSARRYLPGIQPISGFDFQSGVDLSTYNTSLNITLQDLKSSDYPVNRYVDMYGDYGFTMGYIFDKTSSESAKRLANTSVFWDLRKTKKSYPIAVNNKVGTANAGDYYAIEGYRRYFLKEQELTNFTIIEDAEAQYIYIDAHKEIPFISRSLSANIGKKIEVLNSENFALFNEYVSAEGMTFAITADYGTAVLKILK